MAIKMHRQRVRSILVNPEGPVGQELTKSGIRINNRAKRLCPVDTGRLRSSIYSTQPLPVGRHRLNVQVRTNVNYSRFVELGTRYMRARPYLRPALEQEVR